MTRIRTVLGLFATVLVSLLFHPQASANPFPLTVYVGYADNVHCPNFNTNPLDCLNNANLVPNPWSGSSGFAFIGTGIPTAPSVPLGFDAGALRLDNTSGSPVAVIGVTVNIGGIFFPLWSGFTIPNDTSIILTQTVVTQTGPMMFDTNFDTSDVASNGPSVIPQISITIDAIGGATTTTLMDTNQILNTGGSDLGCSIPGCNSVSEAHDWSLIPGQTATPEPASILLLGSGLLSLGTFVRRKSRA
jgi:hypothetical protein